MFFSDTINMVNVKLCLMVLIELTHSYHCQWPWPFIPLSVTLSVFRGHSSVKHHCQWPWLYFEVTAVSNSLPENCMFLFSEVETLYDWWLCQVDHEYTTVSDWCTWSREIIDIFHLEKPFNVDFFSHTIKASSVKFCLFITFPGICISILGLMALTLFQGHRCVRNINCKLLDKVYLSPPPPPSTPPL